MILMRKYCTTVLLKKIERVFFKSLQYNYAAILKEKVNVNLVSTLDELCSLPLNNR